MKKILVGIEKDYISFSLSLEVNNKVSITQDKKLILTEQLILKNKETISKGINNLCNRIKIQRAVIKNSEIYEIILTLLKSVSSIEKIYFKDDKELSYTECSLILENKYLEFINCYSIPRYLLDRFDTIKQIKVKTRSNVSGKSKFAQNNNIKTYSDIYYKREIIVDDEKNKENILDIIDFLKNNKYLEKIKINNYNYKNLITFLNTLNKYNKENVILMVKENKDLLKDVKKLKSLERKYNVKIKIDYSEEYKKKNYIKQINFNIIKTILIILVLLTICIVGLSFYLNDKSSKQINNLNEAINKIIEDNTVIENIGEEEILEEIEKEENKPKGQSYYTNYKEVFKELKGINSDTIGWIRVNNTKVNYPVVQTVDNKYYLNHAYDRENNLAGWIYMDYRNNVDTLDKNTIIYGHNITRDFLMFGSLRNTLDETWYKNIDNQIITFNTIKENISWQIFSIYTIEKTSDYLITNFSTQKSYKTFIEKIRSRSIYDFGIEVNEEDKILTLSTCYQDDKQRLVIHAKRI